MELRDKVGGNFVHYYYLFDAQGSGLGLTDDSGNLVGGARYKYDPYGKELSDPVGTRVFNPFGYAGGYGRPRCCGDRGQRDEPGQDPPHQDSLCGIPLGQEIVVVSLTTRGGGRSPQSFLEGAVAGSR